jgi:hypothetical protein
MCSLVFAVGHNQTSTKRVPRSSSPEWAEARKVWERPNTLVSIGSSGEPYRQTADWAFGH